MLAGVRHTTRPAVAEALPSAGFRKAFKFWLEAKGECDLPVVGAIDPLKIPKEILPDISIIAVEDGDKRLFVRLVGERIKMATGVNPTRKWGDDVEKGEEVMRAYMECVEARAPLYCEGPTVWSKHDYRTYKALMLPYAASDWSIRRILTYLEFV